MDEIRLKNFRCFREEQTGRLAPLTLLVGENSTGKTSFLAMIRALWDIARSFRLPDFKEEPYDLGSFEDIAHYRGGRAGQAETFEAGFGVLDRSNESTGDHTENRNFNVTFGKKGTIPALVRVHGARDDTWFELYCDLNQPYSLTFHTRRGTWKKQAPGKPIEWPEMDLMAIIFHLLNTDFSKDSREQYSDITPLHGSPPMVEADLSIIRQLLFGFRLGVPRPFASAPVRSKPRRTYDPTRPTPNPEGENVPTYLASTFSQNEDEWAVLKSRLEGFGRAAGLFDEISIKRLGKRGSEPFQVQVRKGGDRLKGSPRNLIDVGYGVSQALPVITELLREGAPPLFLLQQPEVHLHPMAQAALGSLFCQLAGPERQLIIETHSDHLIDRVRMDVRDGVSLLKPEDVSILYFERNDLDVRIHSIRIDEEGNIVDAPDTYRSFFMDEVTRSLGW